MKTSCLSIILLILSVLSLDAQSVIISDDGTTSPDASAILEVKSDSLAVLFPRMSYIEIAAIASPATGLTVYNTSCDLICTFDGSNWLAPDGDRAFVTIGDAYQGGIVYEVDASGRHGKIAAVADLGTADWGCQGSAIVSGNGAQSDTDGAANTAAILLDCGVDNIAAKQCDDYYVIEDGIAYDDWYLPAVQELLDLYDVYASVGGFVLSYYYSSTELNDERAYRVSFDTGLADGNNKDGNNRYVRPIRTF